MKLPAGIQYFCIGCTEAQLNDFYAAEDSIFNNFGITIKVQQMKYELLLELLKEEVNCNFQILIRSEHPFFLKKAVETFQELFSKSLCSHKLGIINPGTREEVDRQIYFTLLGSLNLTCVYSTDGLLKTYGIQVEKRTKDLSGTVIPTFVEPEQIEITNVQRIILDMTRCGVLEPVAYFAARDFGTCIAQVLLPNSPTWSLAYLIQLGHDSVKICFVNEQQTKPSEPEKVKEVIPIMDEVTVVSAPSVSTKFEQSVLKNSEYPFCRNISNILAELKSSPPSNSKMTDAFIKEINFLLKSTSKRNSNGFFFDVQEPFEVKKRFSRLCRELELEILTIRDQKRTKMLADSLKGLRKQVNFLNIDLKREAKEIAPPPAIITIAPKRKPKEPINWLNDARAFSTVKSRTSYEMFRARTSRLDREQKDGIITMPLLEPYLEVKWPSNNVIAALKPALHPNPIIQIYSDAITAREEEIKSNKRFGV